MGKFIDLTGQVFGKLMAIRFIERKNNKTFWEWGCSCGNKHIASIDNVKSGQTNSCGCLRKESRKLKRILNGMYYDVDSPLRHIWTQMKSRCYKTYNKSFKNYGGRGITVCDEWLGDDGFNNFYIWAIVNGYKEEKLLNGLNKWTLDRIDNNGNYEPSNCRWATRKEQANNTRTNRYVEFDGTLISLKKYCEINNLKYSIVKGRKTKGTNDIITLNKSIREISKNGEIKLLKFIKENNGICLCDIEMAKLLNVSNETIRRWRKKLIAQKLIIISNKKLIIQKE